MRRSAALVACVVAIAGCGAGSGSAGHPAIVVAAASSLRNAFTDYARDLKPATARLSFGGSDELAAQIRGGSPIDVFAAANAKLPDQLFAEGKVERPVQFTGNRLVLAVPAGATSVKQLSDLVKPGVKLAIGSKAVPIGSYTRDVLAALPSIEMNRILANVKSEEPDVAGIVGKLTQGAVDAGFVYITDVKATGGRLRALRLPAAVSPIVVYEAAVVKGSKHPDAARRFIRGLVSGSGQATLLEAGFLPAR